MSPNMKLSVLAFVGAAAAFPQYNVPSAHGHGHASAHSKHFTPSGGRSGYAYPTGGWGRYNSTSPSAVAQGTGIPSKPAAEETTCTDSLTSTTTSTVYLTQSPASAASAATPVTPVTGLTSDAECAVPQTVYVTETNRVTVTVPAGGALSSAAPRAPSSSYEAIEPSAPAASAPVASAPAASSPAASVPVASAPAASAPVASAPVASAPAASVPVASVPVASAPEASYEAATSFVLASSEAAKPSAAAVAVTTPAPAAEAVTTTYAAASSAVESSAAPASTSASSAGGYAGGKRGLVYRWDGAADCKSFEGQNFGFVWNWEADTKGDIGSFAGNFIPTLRTLANAGDWASKAQAAIDAGSKVIFGLNEPDIASQANLDVPSLCTAWQANMNDFYGKVTVVGPSVSSSENEGQGLSYLQQFVEQCPEAKFDDINIHWYGPASAGFDAFKAHYEDAASKFPGKKIWVTEFGLTGATEDESADFLKSAQSYLDGESTCAGYSYFAVGTFDPTANLIGTMSALTKAGEVYVS
ncbi:hypothetical protein PMIN04_003281 [Paraphaeosphaeria minitans]